MNDAVQETDDNERAAALCDRQFHAAGLGSAAPEMVEMVKAILQEHVSEPSVEQIVGVLVPLTVWQHASQQSIHERFVVMDQMIPQDRVDGPISQREEQTVDDPDHSTGAHGVQRRADCRRPHAAGRGTPRRGGPNHSLEPNLGV